jgi:signal transduction histidine kinase
MTTLDAILPGAADAARPPRSLRAPEAALLSALLVVFIGFADYWAGKDVSLSIIYAVPIWIAAWYVGPVYALFLSIASVAVWLGGDAASGVTYDALIVPAWNSAIRFGFYILLIGLLQRLKSLQQNLGEKIEERAVALTRESAERERLERDLLEVSEREQRRIGQDLHDGLCQHLTGTAIAGHVLAEKLASRGLPEAQDSRRIVDHVEEAIVMARGMAKGLHPVELAADGLMQALDEFANTTSELFGVTCRFECDSPVLVRQPTTASHLYRIAQEAVGNAIKHGRADTIVIALENSEQGVRLTISDNGLGMPSTLPPGHGMGLRIMANRAKVMRAEFAYGPRASRGAEVVCIVALDQLNGEIPNV